MVPNCRAVSAVVLAMVVVSSAALGPQLRTSERRAVAEDNKWGRAVTGKLLAWMPLCNADGTDPYPAVQVASTSPARYTESAAGSFGRSASDFGTAASNVGKSTTSPDIAAPPSGTGATEQTAGSFGSTAGSVGTAAGSYGQTAGSFHGQMSPSGPDAIAKTVEEARLREVGRRTLQIQRQIVGARTVLYAPLPEIKAVPCDGLAARLDAVTGTRDAPDVLFGPRPRSWTAEQSVRYFLSREPSADSWPDGARPRNGIHEPPEYFLLRGAPHLQTAQAFALAFTESCVGCIATEQDGSPLAPDWKQLLDVATEAVERVANGSAPGDLADPDAARYLEALGPRLMLPPGAALGDNGASRDNEPPKVHAVGIHIHQGGPLALVSTRLLAEGPSCFGIVHPYVVLRQGTDGHWRVLYLALNPPAGAAASEEEALFSGTPPSRQEQYSGPLGVRLASPPEGDLRGPQPDLWWDNLGGAGMQLVEWQRQYPSGWQNPHLYVVPDQDPRVQTRVTAAFAGLPGRYRWRVWSLGAVGSLRLSEWRTFVVAGGGN